MRTLEDIKLTRRAAQTFSWKDIGRQNRNTDWSERHRLCYGIVSLALCTLLQIILAPRKISSMVSSNFHLQQDG